MKKANGLIIGLIFIAVGLLYACNALDILEFSIFFPGWWTLFIIIPCIVALTRKNEDKTGPVIGLAIGICFLINAQDFAFHIDFWPMAVAVLCIAIGVKLMFPDKKKNHRQVEYTEYTYDSTTGSTTVNAEEVKTAIDSIEQLRNKDRENYLNNALKQKTPTQKQITSVEEKDPYLEGFDSI